MVSACGRCLHASSLQAFVLDMSVDSHEALVLRVSYLHPTRTYRLEALVKLRAVDRMRAPVLCALACEVAPVPWSLSRSSVRIGVKTHVLPFYVI